MREKAWKEEEKEVKGGGRKWKRGCKPAKEGMRPEGEKGSEKEGGRMEEEETDGVE